ncbi:DUF4231 domain-containing protein [Halomarina rubra]|uniref:DUF4231 domain-containing protein n=1 Tax=Halomarina rubra TaxID=2071873 RepID=A0ABD6AY81_9EURY|nr:DUF4231 domain-containing protein [Halomarina rubra]
MADKFDEFYEEYFEEQFEWYDDKAGTNKCYYRVMKILEIILAASLPVAATLYPVTTNPFWKNVIILLSILLIIFEALESFLNYQKKWINYRTTAEGLRREKYMYRTKTHEYAVVNDPETLFVERVMALTDQENRYWEIATRKAQEA